MGKGHEELLSYRDEVVRELERRSVRLKAIDVEVAALQFSLESVSGGAGVLTGEAARLTAKVAYRSRLKRQLQAKQRERQEALDELRRAEQRLVEVDNELEESESSDGGGD